LVGLEVVLEVVMEDANHHAAVFHHPCAATSSGGRLGRASNGRSRSLGRFSDGKVSQGSWEARFYDETVIKSAGEERRRLMPVWCMALLGPDRDDLTISLYKLKLSR